MNMGSTLCGGADGVSKLPHISDSLSVSDRRLTDFVIKAEQLVFLQRDLFHETFRLHHQVESRSKI